MDRASQQARTCEAEMSSSACRQDRSLPLRCSSRTVARGAQYGLWLSAPVPLPPTCAASSASAPAHPPGRHRLADLAEVA